jgi:hypothetical protein
LIRKNVSIIVSIALVVVTLVFPLRMTAQASPDPATEKTKLEVQKLSTDRGKQVQVKLRDQTKIKGYITAVEQDTFTVSDLKRGTSQTVAFAEVSSVKRPGGISSKTWLILGAIATGAVVTWIIAKPAVCDGGAQTRGIC